MRGPAAGAEVVRPAAPVTVGGLTRQIARWFRSAGFEDVQMEARALVRHVLGIDLTALVMRADEPVGDDHVDQLMALVRRRLQDEPIGRILAERSFFGLDLEVSSSTLEPRDDTEALVRAALEVLRRDRPGRTPPRIADLGTGTGAILIALLVSLPEASGIAVDISSGALATAGRNAVRHGVAGRLKLVQASFADALAPHAFDLIVSNPPYIPSGDIAGLDRNVRDYDPRIALDGGNDGLEAYRCLIPRSRLALRDHGGLLVEIGHTQGTDVAALMEAADFTEVRVLPDLAGRDRVVTGRAGAIAGLRR